MKINTHLDTVTLSFKQMYPLIVEHVQKQTGRQVQRVFVSSDKAGFEEMRPGDAMQGLNVTLELAPDNGPTT